MLVLRFIQTRKNHKGSEKRKNIFVFQIGSENDALHFARPMALQWTSFLSWITMYKNPAVVAWW